MWELEQYSAMINRVMTKGSKRSTRAGDAYSTFGETLTIDMSEEFPLLRGRKMFYRSVFGELAAMLRGPKTTADFKRFDCNYWDAWGDGNGNLKLDYGNKWRDFNGIDQLKQVVEKLKTSPTDRRLLVSGWDPGSIPELSLPCCHMLYQWYVRGQSLDMLWYQRSADLMVGVPSDIILCAAWNAIMAVQAGLKPGVIKLVLGDTHIYSNHLEPALDYLRALNDLQRMSTFKDKLTYTVNPDTTIDTFVPDDILVSYQGKHMGKLNFQLNV